MKQRLFYNQHGKSNPQKFKICQKLQFFASLPISTRLQSIAAGTAPNIQGATAWPPCPHCKWDRPNHAPNNCKKKPALLKVHTCTICKKENVLHTPDKCWQNPLNWNKPQNANVSRVSAGMTLLKVIPKVCNNTDGKTTHKSSVNIAEFNIHSFIESQKIDNNNADSVDTQFIKSRRWKTKLQFPHIQIDATIDTGAEITCVSSK